MRMSKQVILTGLRANNDLHIGNYFGALLPIVDMAKQRSEEFEVHLFVPDLHSFTTPIDHSQLQAQILHNLRLFVAAGLPLDNPSVHIYRQSYIPAHSELTVILNSFTGMGQMERMTQFKDKSAVSPEERRALLNHFIDVVNEAVQERVSLPDSEIKTVNKYFRQAVNTLEKARKDQTSVGLFDYPVLMAADILLYGASYVPVGDDQTQHLEFTRDIAERMNAKFGELFVVPEPVAKQHEFFGKDQGLRIKDLVDPVKKMSKSDESGRGIIFLGDAPEDAAKKVMGATTDSLGSVHLDYDNQPGVSNLLQILALLQNRPLAEVAAEHEGQARYGDFKTTVADAVKAFLQDFQTRLASVDDAALQAKLQADEQVMNLQANATLRTVQEAVGLR